MAGRACGSADGCLHRGIDPAEEDDEYAVLLLLLAEVADSGDVDDEELLWWKCGMGNERRSDRADESLRDE